MERYQISASINGAFLFRTDPERDKDRAVATAKALRKGLPDADIRLYELPPETRRDVTAELLGD